MTLRHLGKRIRVGEGGGGPEVHVRAPRLWGLLVFLPFWLAGWTSGGIMTILAFVREPQLFLGVWLVGWAFGEVFVVLAWSWAAFGKEVIAVEGGALRVGKRIGPFRRERAYSLDEVGNVRAAGWFGSPTSPSDSLRQWG